MLKSVMLTLYRILENISSIRIKSSSEATLRVSVANSISCASHKQENEAASMRCDLAEVLRSRKVHCFSQHRLGCLFLLAVAYVVPCLA